MIRNIQNIRLRKALSFISGEFGGKNKTEGPKTTNYREQ
jgi:hypothetical protein